MLQSNNYLQYIVSLSWAEASNAVTAIVAGAAAFGVIRSMDAKTSQAIRCGFVTLSAGLFGEGFGTVIPGAWQLGFDALLFGGSLALFIGSRRHAHLVPEGMLARTSLVTTLYSWMVFFLTVN
jgi:hypothetical protein